MSTETLFKCKQCELGFKTDKGLRIHAGKAHKLILQQTPEKERSSPIQEEPFLSLTPINIARDEEEVVVSLDKVKDSDVDCEVKEIEPVTNLCKQKVPPEQTLTEDVLTLKFDLEYWTWPKNKAPPLKVHHPQEGLGTSPNLYTDALGFDQISYRFKTGVCDVFEIT